MRSSKNKERRVNWWIDRIRLRYHSVRGLKREIQKLQEELEKIKEQIYTDSLTGLLNRSGLDELGEIKGENIKNKTGVNIGRLGGDEFVVTAFTGNSQVLKERLQSVFNKAIGEVSGISQGVLPRLGLV